MYPLSYIPVSLYVRACQSISFMQVGIITPAQQILDFRALEVMKFMENDATSLSLKLREIARCG